MKNLSRILTIAIVLSSTVMNISFGQVYGWRGPGRSGIYNEKGLMKSWPGSGPSMIWETEGLGKGYSSATVTDDAVYITGTKNNKDVLSAFSQEGRKLWEVEYGSITPDVSFPESRCTPTFAKGRILVVSGQGDLASVTKDGKIVWTVNYYKKYNAAVQRFWYI